MAPGTPPAERPAARGPALALSAAMHAAVLLAFAAVRLRERPSPAFETLNGTFSETAEAVLTLPDLAAAPVATPRPTAVPAAAPLPLDAGDVAAVAAPEPAAGSSTVSTAADSGGGAGGGGGHASGFFSGDGGTGSVVYVVDCSKSMRKPFPCPEETRFGRVRAELVRSIGRLADGQRYAVVFFSDRPFVSAGGRFVRRGTAQDAAVRKWVRMRRPAGGTLPESALKAALTLRPDVVYFLTDGGFNPRTVDRVVDFNRGGTRIHTIGFGDDVRTIRRSRAEAGELPVAVRLLTDLAGRTGGTAKFIGGRPPRP